MTDDKKEDVMLGDLLPSQGDLVGEIREAIRSSLAIELGELWYAQNPGAKNPGAYAQLTIKLDHTDIVKLADAAARAAARRVMVLDVPIAALERHMRTS